MSVRVAINGFGRIGRNILRAVVEGKRKDIEVVAINDLGPVETNAHLLRYDSVHGRFPGEVTVKGDTISCGNGAIKVTAVKDPAQLPWKELGIDIALECTGIFTSKKKASAHLEAGAKRVLVSAPADGVDLTVVYGVNHDKLMKSHIVVSNASCTTNCLAPVAKVLNDAVGIDKGFMTTVHSYTNDQPSLDQIHKDLYRARAAALNIIPTSTGAAKAVGLVLPELAGRLDGVSIRVPTPNVSVIDFKFVAKRATTKDEINGAVKRAAEQQLKGILGYTDAPNVSSDFNHDPHSSIFHMDQTKVDRRHAGSRDVLVRQRVGLLQPHDRHRGGDGQAGLTVSAMSSSVDVLMKPTFRSLDDADVKGKRVLLRVDLNVPMQDGKVTDSTRIEEIAPTITELADKGGKVILLSHFGRPKGPNPKDSLRPVAAEVARIVKRPVAFAEDCVGPKAEDRHRRDEKRRHSLSGKHPLPSRRGKERQGLRQETRGARRHLCR